MLKTRGAYFLVETSQWESDQRITDFPSDLYPHYLDAVQDWIEGYIIVSWARMLDRIKRDSR
jgi:hypothetical protein